MRKLVLILAILLPILSSCSRNTPSLKEYITHYQVIVNMPLEVYSDMNSFERYQDIPYGDTVNVVLPGKMALDPGKTEVYHKNYRMYVRGLGTRTRTISSRRYRKIDWDTYYVLSAKKLTPYGPYPMYSNTTSSDRVMYSTPTTGATIHTGPRGGRFYYNSKGNKTYVKSKH